MASKRDQIRMSDAEMHDFLQEQKIVTCATIGPNGRPHLMPLWYVPSGTELRAWTFAKSQKVKNLEREPRATLQVEAGVEYQELRGVMMECEVAIERDTEKVADLGVQIFDRYTPGMELPEGTRDMVMLQAPKRVAMTFTPTRIASWDHSKLGGAY
jgi:PPOX class probable F420-dependent enzyme